ncbi:MAG: hypothetical protein R2751_05105 [Bacteroidales bacterium]
MAPPLLGQETEEEDPGQVSARIYSHFNYSLDPDSPAAAFEVRRAYFGYERALNSHFSAEVKLDIGSVDDDSEYSLIRRYAYFKNAYLSYRNNNLTAWFGLTDMLQFKVQEKFWGYRYLYKSYMDEYKFGSSADLGAGVQYKVSSRITADLMVSNGEGYKNYQYDDVFRAGAGLTLLPAEGLTLRAYYTVHTTRESPQMTWAGFAGYERGPFRVGAEYIHQFNYKFNGDHSRYGYSAYARYGLGDRWELFARYDQLYSNILPGEESPWNLADDGSALMGGIQFAPIDGLKMALNYQDWVEYASNGGSAPFLYLNFEVDF